METEVPKDNNELEDRLLTNIELKKFSWGAASLCWIWGIFNGAFLQCISSLMVTVVLIGIVLLTVPEKICALIVYIAYILYLGVRGSKWAWENKSWESLQHYVEVQTKWNIAGLICFGIFYLIPLVSFAIIYMIFGESIFASINNVKFQEKDKTAVELFLTDTNVTSAANADALIEYLVKKKSEVTENKYTRYDKNTVKVETSIFAPDDNAIETLYTFKKEPLCKIKDKNCYIISYKYENGKITPKSKIYFDSIGRYRYIKVITKK